MEPVLKEFAGLAGDIASETEMMTLGPLAKPKCSVDTVFK